MAILILAALGTDIVLSPLAQAKELESVWQGRRRAPTKTTQLAALPGAITPALRAGLADQLPGARPSLPLGRWAAHPDAPAVSPALRQLLETIPLNAVSVGDVYDGKGPGVPLLLVQDIHLNLEAQRNISRLLAAAAASGRVDVIGVEGAFGKFDFTPFHRFPRADLVRTVADAYLRLNRLAAPSYVGITLADKAPAFIGVDDADHYRLNVEAVVASRAARAGAQKTLSALRQDLARTKAAAYSPRLAAFDRLTESYRAGETPFGLYLQKLADGVAKPEPVIDRFLRAYAMERALDFPRVERERRQVIQSLAAKLSDAELSRLLSDSIAYKTGRIGFGVYYTSLSRLCAARGVALASAPAFDAYVRYVMLADGIRAEELFDGVARLETSVVAALTENDLQRALVRLSDHASLAERLLTFALSPSDWKSFRTFTPSGPVFASPEAARLAAAASALAPQLKPFEDFYREADLRSETMLSRILSAGRVGRALVVGGFHAPEITAALRARGIPYAVVTPRLTRVDVKDGSAYLSVFAREKTPLDRLFQGERLFLSPNATAVGSANPEAAANALRLSIDAAVEHRRAGIPLDNGPITDAQIATSGDRLIVRARGANGSAVDVAVDPAAPIGERFALPSTTLRARLYNAGAAFRRWTARVFGRRAPSADDAASADAEPPAVAADAPAVSPRLRRAGKIRPSALAAILATGVIGAALAFFLVSAPRAPDNAPNVNMEKEDDGAPTAARLAGDRLSETLGYYTGNMAAFDAWREADGEPQRFVATNREDRTIRGWAVLYDNVVFAQAHAAQRTPETLRESAAFMEKISAEWATRKGAEPVFYDAARTQRVPNAFVTAVRARDGEATEFRVDSGPTLHVGIAAMNIYRMGRESDPVGFREGRYNRMLELALQQARYAHNLARVRDGADPRLAGARMPDAKSAKIWIPFGPVGRDDRDQAFGDGRRFNDLAATEHQLDAYNLWAGLGDILGEDPRVADFRAALPLLENFIFSPALWNDRDGRFNAGWRHWDNTSNTQHPTDVQAWAVTMLSPEVMVARLPGGQRDVDALFSALDRDHAVREDGRADGAIVGYAFLPGQAQLTPEWSAQVAEAKARFGLYLTGRPDAASRARGEAMLDQARDLTLRLAALPLQGAGGLAYAYNANGSAALRFDTGVGFPTHTGPSLVPTVYILSLLNNHAPAGRGVPLPLFQAAAPRAAAPQIAPAVQPVAPRPDGFSFAAPAGRVDLWFRSYAHPDKGLLPSTDGVYVGADGRISANNPFKRVGATDPLAIFGAGDEAQAAIALLNQRDTAAAKKIFEFFRGEYNRQKDGPGKSFRGFAHIYTVDGKESPEFRLIPHQPESGPLADTGANLWAAIFAMQYHRATGDREARDLAENIAAWAGGLNGNLPGVPMGPVAGEANWPRLYSTEQNVLYYSVLRMLVADDAARGNVNPRAAQNRAELAGVQGLIRNGLTANAGAWQGLPWRGGLLSDGNRLQLEGVRYITTATYLLMAAGPEGLKEMGYGEADVDRLLRFAENEFAVRDRVKGTNEIIGYDVTNDAGRRQTRRAALISVDASSQMMIVFQMFRDHYRAKGDNARADELDSHIGRIRDRIDSLRTSQGSYPATDSNERLLFDRWLTAPPTTGSLSATAMRSFANGFNPLAADGVLNPGASGVAPTLPALLAFDPPAAVGEVAAPAPFWLRDTLGRQVAAVNPVGGERTNFDPDAAALIGPGAMIPTRTVAIGPGPAFSPLKDGEGKEIVRREYTTRVLSPTVKADADTIATLKNIAPKSQVYAVTTSLNAFNERGERFERQFTLYYGRFTLLAQKGVAGRAQDQDIFELARIDDSDSVILFSYDGKRPSYGFPAGYQRYARVPAAVANLGKPAAAEKIELRETVSVEQTESMDPDSGVKGYKLTATGVQAGLDQTWTGYVDSRWMVLSTRVGDRVEVSIRSAGALMNTITFGWLPLALETRDGTSLISSRRILGTDSYTGNTISGEVTPQPGTPRDGVPTYAQRITEAYDLMGNMTMSGDHQSRSVTVYNYEQTRAFRLMSGLGDIGIPMFQIGPDGVVMREWDRNPTPVYSDAGRFLGVDMKVRDPGHPERGWTVQRWRVQRYPAAGGRIQLMLAQSDTDRERVSFSFEKSNPYLRPSSVTREVKPVRGGLEGRSITMKLRFSGDRVDFDRDGNFVYDVVDGPNRYAEHQNISGQPVLRVRKSQVNGRESVREERAARFDYNNVSGEFVPVDSEIRIDGEVVERRRLLDIDRRTGNARFEVESALSGQKVIETINALGSLAEVLDPSRHEVVRYNTDFEFEVYRRTGLRIRAPSEILNVPASGAAPRRIWLYEAPNARWNKETLETVELTRRSDILPGTVQTTTLAARPWAQYFGPQLLKVDDMQIVRNVMTDASGRREVSYAYTTGGVQRQQISLEFDARGTLIPEATLFSAVVLDERGRPTLSEIAAAGDLPERSGTRLITQSALGEIHEDVVNARGLLIRRYEGRMNGGRFEAPVFDGATVSRLGRWVGGDFVRDAATDYIYGNNVSDVAYQLSSALDTPMHTRSYTFRVNADGEALGAAREASRLVDARLSPAGEPEFVSEHQELVNGEVNMNWREVRNRRSFVVRSFDLVPDAGVLVPVAVVDYEYGLRIPGMPSRTRMRQTDRNGDPIGEVLAEGAADGTNPIRRQGDALFPTAAGDQPVLAQSAVVVSRVTDRTTGSVWLEARDRRGRIRAVVQGIERDGKFEPNIIHQWSFNPESSPTLPNRLNVPTQVDARYVGAIRLYRQGLAPIRQASVSEGSYQGMERLPENRGLIGLYGTMSQTRNPFIGVIMQDVNDARGLLAVRREGYMEKDRFVERRSAHYDYAANVGRTVPYGVASRIEIREKNRVVRLLEYDRVENGFVTYRVISDEIEHGLKFVGYGAAGRSFEDHEYNNDPRQVRIYMQYSIPVYSVTDVYEGQPALYKIYDASVVQRNGETYVVVHRREPDIGERGPLGEARRFVGKSLDSDRSLVQGPVWGIIHNGRVIHRHEGRWQIVTDELTTWNVGDHLAASPVGQVARAAGLDLDGEYDVIRNYALDPSKAPEGVDVIRLDVVSLVPQELINRTPDQIDQANKAEAKFWFRAYGLPILSILSILTMFIGVLYPLLKIFLWFRGGPINVNRATDKEVQALTDLTFLRWARRFTYNAAVTAAWVVIGLPILLPLRLITGRRLKGVPLSNDLNIRELSIILAARQRVGSFATYESLEAALQDSNPEMIPRLRAMRQRLVFDIRPGDGVAPVEVWDAASVADVQALAQSADLRAALTALPDNHPLKGVARQALEFNAYQFMSTDEIAGVLLAAVGRLAPGTMTKTEATERIMADLTRRAFWAETPERGRFLKPFVRTTLSNQARILLQQMGIGGDNVDQYVNEIVVRELEGLSFGAERLTVDAAPVISRMGLRLPVNRGGQWTLASMDDELVRKIVRRAIPFLASQAPYEEFMLGEVAWMLANPPAGPANPARIREFLERHRAYWYPLLKRELNEKWENMRDIRSKVKWDYAFTQEELSDMFRYLSGKSEWGRFPAAYIADPDLQRQQIAVRETMNRLRTGTLPTDNAGMDATIRDTYRPLVDNVRGKLGLAKINTPQNQSLMTIRPFFYLMTSGTIFRRFLGDSLANKSMQSKLAAFFWAACLIATVALLAYLTVYIGDTLHLIPAPFKVNLLFTSFTMPSGFQYVVHFVTLMPLGDATILTALAMIKVAKAFVAGAMRRLYRIGEINTWPSLRKELPALLKDPENLREFGEFLASLNDRSPDKNQHFLTTPEEAAWRAILEKARAGTLTAADLPGAPSSKKTEERFKSQVGKWLRTDVPARPRNMDELKSITFQISGWAEEFWLDWKTIIKVEPGAIEHRVGMMARSYEDQWTVFIERLREDGKLNDAQHAFLASLAKQPAQDMAGAGIAEGSETEKLMTEWINDHLGVGYHNLKGALQQREIYRGYIQRFYPNATPVEIERMVDEKVQYMVKHDNTLLTLDEKIGGQLLEKVRAAAGAADGDVAGLVAEALADRARLGPLVRGRLSDLLAALAAEPTSKARARAVMLELEQGSLLEALLADLRVNPDMPLPAYMAGIAGIPGLGNPKQVEFYLRFMARNRIDLSWWKKNFSDSHAGAKYTQWANFFSRVRGELTIAYDWDHENMWEEMAQIPMVGREFDIDPKLAIAPYKTYIFTKDISSVGKAMGTAEEGWFYEQLAKMGVGQVLFYGKGVIRTQFARDMEALQDEYVGEDAQTAKRFATFGMTTKTLNYFRTGKGLSTDYGSALTPLRKWSTNDLEGAFGATAMKYLLSPDVDARSKIDSADSFSFYLKKTRVRRYIVLLALLHYAFPFNPLTGLALIFYVSSIVLGQAISSGALYGRWDDHGKVRGTIVFFFVDMPFTLIPFFISILPQYDDAVGKGFRKFAKFIPTMGKGGPTKRASFRDTYTSNSYGIEIGVFLMWFAILLSPIDPSRGVIWFFTILAAAMFWMGPFLLNPTRPVAHATDQFILGAIFWGGLGAIVGFYAASALVGLAPLAAFVVIFLIIHRPSLSGIAGFFRAPRATTSAFFSEMLESNTVDIVHAFYSATRDMLLNRIPGMLFLRWTAGWLWSLTGEDGRARTGELLENWVREIRAAESRSARWSVALRPLGALSLILFPPVAGLMDKFTGQRYSPTRRWAVEIWAELAAYHKVMDDQINKKGNPAGLSKDILGDINGFAVNHFAGIKSFAEGRARGNPSYTYLLWMRELTSRARQNLLEKGVDLPAFDPATVPNVIEAQPNALLRVIDMLPLVDWTLAIFPGPSDLPGFMQREAWTAGARTAVGRVLRNVAWGAAFLVVFAVYPLIILFIHMPMRLWDLVSERNEAVKLGDRSRAPLERIGAALTEIRTANAVAEPADAARIDAALQELVTLATDPSTSIRIPAQGALREAGITERQWVNVWSAQLNSANAQVRWEAANGLRDLAARADDEDLLDRIQQTLARPVDAQGQVAAEATAAAGAVATRRAEIQPVSVTGSVLSALTAALVAALIALSLTIIPADWTSLLGGLFTAAVWTITVGAPAFVSAMFSVQAFRLWRTRGLPANAPIRAGPDGRRNLIPAFDASLPGPDRPIDISGASGLLELAARHPSDAQLQRLANPTTDADRDAAVRLDGAIRGRAAFVFADGPARADRRLFVNGARVSRLSRAEQASLWRHERLHLESGAPEFWAYLAQVVALPAVPVLWAIEALSELLSRRSADERATRNEENREDEKLALLQVAARTNNRALRVTALLELFPADSLALDQISPSSPALGVYAAVSDRAAARLDETSLDLVLTSIHSALLPDQAGQGLKAGSLAAISRRFNEGDPVVMILESADDLARVQATLDAIAAKGRPESVTLVTPEGVAIDARLLRVPANVTLRMAERRESERLTDVLIRSGAMTAADVATRFFRVLVSENYNLGPDFIDIDASRLQLLLLVLNAQVPVAVEVRAFQLQNLQDTMRLIMTQA